MKKPTVIPMIIGALGTIQKSTDKNISKIPGSPCLEEIQKISHCGTAHLFRRVLSMERKYKHCKC